MLNTLSGWIRRYRSVLLLVGAIALGVMAAFGARNYIADQLAIERERLVPKRDEIEVVVAKRDLRRGELIGPDTMASRRIPKEYVPGTAIRPERFDGYVGSRLNTALRSGEPLLNQSVDGADASSFSSKVRTGIRALTVVVDEVNSLSGMLQPGDRIDLQLSVRPPVRYGQATVPEMTAPLMQDVLVLATGRQVRAATDDGLPSRGFNTITVEVTPEQAQRLIVAQRGGRLTALLRNRDDRMAVAQRPIDIDDLLGLQPPARVPAGRPPTEIIVGGRGQLSSSAGQPAGGVPMAPGIALAAGNLVNQVAAAAGQAMPFAGKAGTERIPSQAAESADTTVTSGASRVPGTDATRPHEYDGASPEMNQRQQTSKGRR